MGMSTQGGGIPNRGQLVGGPVGRPIMAQPGNRYTRARVQPISQPRPMPQPRPQVQARPAPRPTIAPRPVPRPAVMNPNVSMGFGPAPLPSMPLTQQPQTQPQQMPQQNLSMPSQPPQMMPQPAATITNSLFEPQVMEPQNMEPQGLDNPQGLTQAKAFNAYYQQMTQGQQGYVPVSEIKYQFNQLTPEQQMSYLTAPRPTMAQALGTQSPLLSTTNNFGF